MCHLAAHIYSSCCHRGPATDIEILSPCDDSALCIADADAKTLDSIAPKTGFCPPCEEAKSQGHLVVKYRVPRNNGRWVFYDPIAETPADWIPSRHLDLSATHLSSEDPGVPSSPTPLTRLRSMSPTKTESTRRITRSHLRPTPSLSKPKQNISLKRTPKLRPKQRFAARGPNQGINSSSPIVPTYTATPRKRSRDLLPQTPTTKSPALHPNKRRCVPRTPQTPMARILSVGCNGSPILRHKNQPSSPFSIFEDRALAASPKTLMSPASEGVEWFTKTR